MVIRIGLKHFCLSMGGKCSPCLSMRAEGIPVYIKMLVWKDEKLACLYTVGNPTAYTVHIACQFYKTLFFDFCFRPPNPQNWLPKIWQKIAYNSACMAIDRRCLHLTGGFRDGRFNGTMQNVVGPTLVAMATKFGLKSPITRIVRQIGRRCFDLLWDFRGWPIQCNHAKSCRADPCCHGNDIWARRGV